MLVALGACAPQVPRQEPTPAAAPLPVAPADRPTSWRIVPSPLSREYALDQRAIIQTTTDSGTFTDTTTLSTEVSFRQTRDGGAAGLIRAVMLASPGNAIVPFQGLSLPIAFVVPAGGRGVLGSPGARPAPTGDPCKTQAEIALSGVRELIVQLPDSVVLGTTWGDSGSYRTCRDGALLTVVTVRTFRVRAFADGDDAGLLTLDRTTRTTVRGSAARGDDTTLVDGTGVGSMTLAIHARSGAILSGEGTGTLDITVRGRTKLERARQVLQSRISRRPD